MNEEREDGKAGAGNETPEQRTVDGLLGLIRPGESDRIEDRIETALQKVADLENDRARRMQIWPRVLGTIGGAAAVAAVILAFIMLVPESQPAIADIDRMLEKMSESQERWYEVEIGRGNTDAKRRGLEGLVCANEDGRFVAFMHARGESSRNEIIVGNDGNEEWAVPPLGGSTPEHQLRMLFEKLRPTVAEGSVDPQRILKMVRQGWTLKRSDIRRKGRNSTRIEASAPRRDHKDQDVVDRIIVEIDPVSFSLERLEAERSRNGVEDEGAYLLFQRTSANRDVPSFKRADYLRTDRPRDPNPDS